MTRVDIIYPVVEGDCVHAGYAYQLYAAIKGVSAELATDDAVTIGPLEDVQSSRINGLLLFRRRCQLRIRAPIEAIPAALSIAGEMLRVGLHLIRLGPPTIYPLQPAARLHAEFVTFAWTKHERVAARRPPRRNFVGHLAAKLLEIAGYTGRIGLGRKRVLHIGRHPAQSGYGVEIEGLTDEQSMATQDARLGGRGHMGCGLFRAGRLPSRLRRRDADRDRKGLRRAPVPADAQIRTADTAQAPGLVRRDG